MKAISYVKKRFVKVTGNILGARFQASAAM
jgi:hypothetical protein